MKENLGGGGNETTIRREPLRGAGLTGVHNGRRGKDNRSRMSEKMLEDSEEKLGF